MLLLDTHALVWLASDRKQLTENGQAAIRQETEVVARSLDDAEAQTVGRIDSLKADVVPQLRKIDKM